MNFNFKNLSENTKRIRIIPKNGTELFANIGVDNPTAMIDEDGVFSVCLSPNETPTISCDGATPEAKLKGYNVIGMNPPPTVDVYVQNILIAENVDAVWINQRWFDNQAFMENAALLGYTVSGTSSNEEVFSNYFTTEGMTFRFVPKTDGFYNGQVYSAKDALQIHSSNSNPTVYKDPITGVITFCIGGEE